jgi:hypothetical protein
MQLLRDVLLAAAAPEDGDCDTACPRVVQQRQNNLQAASGWIAQQLLHPVTAGQWLHSHEGTVLGLAGCCPLLLLLLQDPQLQPLWEELEHRC